MPVRPNAATLRAANLSWSRDGTWVVYARGNTDLFAARIDGDTTVLSLAATPSVERQPALSPDGRWLAYVSDETGRYEVYVRPFPDVNVTRRQVSLNGGFTPVWSRSGSELFFADESMTLYSVPVMPGLTFTIGTPQPLFSAAPFGVLGSQFDVDPNGQRFLMSRPAGIRQRDELVMVESFFDELRRRVPR